MTVSRIMQVSPVTAPKKNQTFMAAHGIVDVFPSWPFTIVVTNPSSPSVTLAKQQRTAVINTRLLKIVLYIIDEPSPYTPPPIHRYCGTQCITNRHEIGSNKWKRTRVYKNQTRNAFKLTGRKTSILKNKTNSNILSSGPCRRRSNTRGMDTSEWSRQHRTASSW